MEGIKQRCDFCKKPAVYDAKTVMGPWAFCCEEHFERLGCKVEGMYKRLEPLVVSEKKCSICGQKKPVSEFYKYVDRHGVERFRTECKQCNLEQRKLRSFKKG